MQRLKNLFKDEAVIGINKLTDYRYWRILRYSLLLLNAWPGKELGETSSKYMILINAWLVAMNSFVISNSILYIRNHAAELSFYQLGHIYINLFLGFVVSSRIIMTLPIFTKYREVTSKFMTKMHLFYYKDVSTYAMKTHRQVHLISHLFTIYLTCQMFSVVCLFNLIPMWINYSSGKYKEKILLNSTYAHSIYYAVPIKMYTHFNIYTLMCIYNWIVTYFCSSLFASLELVLSLIVFHIWGHLKILLHDLGSFPLPAITSLNVRKNTINVEMYSEEELKQVNEKLIRCINYHRLIVEFTQNISNAYDPMLLVYLAFHLVTGCLLLLECSAMTFEALLLYGPLSVILFQQLIQLSVIFELIGSTSEKLKDAVYGVPWEYMDVKNRRTVIIFLMNVQTPLTVKPLGVVEVGVTTMASILKTSVSYFLFLRTI